MSSPNDTCKIKNESNPNGRTFTVTRAALEHSAVLRSLLEDASLLHQPASGEESVTIPIILPTVSDETLDHIFTWASHWQDEFKLDADAANKEINFTHPATINDWDRGFFEKLNGSTRRINGQAMYELLVATNYLDIRPLYRMAVGFVADAMEGLSPEELDRMIDHAQEELDKLMDVDS
ncbi:uncharacterized protein C8A04DRAFT_31425 [Dichotomopilus funicola]|uniref:E3 ubiquitin ligase complex SCF subunit n=1 Tax=Dichotomopilus funicola TaxID=1934379 RepID=A0AAN6ZIZ3_9PEZI|nr:hypothetical protein C8A04DRAFT_31425 [Dichotomopilus funicola]